jgi:hypothetical protein
LFQALLESTLVINEKKEINITEFQRKLNETLKKNPKALNGIFKDTIKAYLAINEDSLDHNANELMVFLMELVEIMKDKKIWQETYYDDLFELHLHFTKHNFENNLLSFIPEEYRIQSVQNFKPLVVIIDGLDEAFVSDQSKRISDWFYTYDDKGNRLEKWTSPDHIKWIFTYRHSVENEKLGYQFEINEFNTLELEEVQPLKGLTDDDVKNALIEEFKEFTPQLSEEFLQEIINKGAVL